jgi:potassium efflux system protein
MHQNCKKLIPFICLLFISLYASSQQTDSVQQPDTAHISDVNNVDHIKQLGAVQAERSMRKFTEDRNETQQEELIAQIKSTTLAAINYVEFGIDTTGLIEELSKTEKWYAIAIDGVLINQGTKQTNRNLQASKKILKELLARTSQRKTALDKYYKKLRNYRNTIDSLSSSAVLYKISSDSATSVRYMKKLMLVSAEIRPADSAFKQAMTNVASLQTKINAAVNQLAASIEQIGVFQKELSSRVFAREFSNITGPVTFIRPFKEILRLSYAKEKLALYFYCVNNTGRMVLLLLLIIVAALFLRSLKKRLKEENKLSEDLSRQLVLRYPLLSAILLIINIFQFTLPEPVFAFDAIIWVISGICLTIIFNNYITKYWMRSWLIMFALFLFACIDNFILQASRIERWFMLVASVVGVVSCCVILFKGRQRELKEKWIVYFIALVGVVELVATLSNIYGQYNASKTLLTTGFFSVVIGILFLWTIRLVNEIFSLAFEAYQAADRKSFYINFKRLGNKVPRIFYVLMIIGWIALLGRSFYAFNSIVNPIKDFFSQEIYIGNYSFSVQSIVLFFFIIILSTLLSRIVSFFAADNADKSGEKKGLGSWLLIVRISIMTAGLMLAFAAAGIPTDKITIILSALGVGIGFGLQTLINNLVSGLIISFEKPVNVGDIIEIGSNSGVMKSIGFRSSVIYTWDGADVIIPNGELLNQHLVNWTLTNTNRRINIIVGVAYGTDLELAQRILKELVTKDERVLQSSPASVMVEKFNDSSIDLKFLCWVKNVREWVAVKSDVMLAIDIAFKENNITIPFPQRDVHIRTANYTNDNEAKEDENKAP